MLTLHPLLRTKECSLEKTGAELLPTVRAAFGVVWAQFCTACITSEATTSPLSPANCTVVVRMSVLPSPEHETCEPLNEEELKE